MSKNEDGVITYYYFRSKASGRRTVVAVMYEFGIRHEGVAVCKDDIYDVKIGEEIARTKLWNAIDRYNAKEDRESAQIYDAEVRRYTSMRDGYLAKAKKLSERAQRRSESLRAKYGTPKG